MTTPRHGETSITAPASTASGAPPKTQDETHGENRSTHPCAQRPVPASVLRQREAVLDTAFARAARDAAEPPEISVRTVRETSTDVQHS